MSWASLRFQKRLKHPDKTSIIIDILTVFSTKVSFTPSNIYYKRDRVDGFGHIQLIFYFSLLYILPPPRIRGWMPVKPGSQLAGLAASTAFSTAGSVKSN